MAFQLGEGFLAMIDERRGRRTASAVMWLMILLLLFSVIAAFGFAWKATIGPIIDTAVSAARGNGINWRVLFSAIGSAFIPSIGFLVIYFVLLRPYLKRERVFHVHHLEEHAKHLAFLERLGAEFDEMSALVSANTTHLKETDVMVRQFINDRLEAMVADLERVADTKGAEPDAPDVGQSQLTKEGDDETEA